MVVVASSSTTRFCETRKQIVDCIIRKLIGICGMGGIGKTTIAVEVLHRVKEEKLFNECAMSVISPKKDLAKVQSDIADMLGLRLYEQSSIARADKLHRRLDNNSVLIILDDIWEEFDPKIIGIDFQGLQVGCKVLFTSREQGLWRKLKKKVEFLLSVLTENEAWDLFEETVVDSLKDKPELQPVAKEIVKECAGLPLALVTLGSALLGKSTHLWKDTLRQLRMDYPTKKRGLSTNVYRSLELSYRFLEEDAKSLFLLCCIYEEDLNISREELVKTAIGLRLLEGMNGLEQARDRVFALLEQLQSRSLLLSGNTKYVRMHDVVREVAKSIASVERGALFVENSADLRERQGHDMPNNFIWISIISNEITDLPAETISPCVKLLRCSDTFLQTTNYLVKGMTELQVLHVFGKESLEFPSSLWFPSSFRTLYLQKCKLNNYTFIKDLPNLECLSFRESHIEELPIEKGYFTNLVSLDMSYCNDLRIIRPGFISGLCQLQELYMRQSEIDWQGGDKGVGRNANIREFELLPSLHTLHIMIKDPSVLPRSPLFSHLEKYQINIGHPDRIALSIPLYEKSCSISLTNFVPLEGNIKFHPKNAQALELDGEFTKDLVHDLVQDGSWSPKFLSLGDIDTLRYIAYATSRLLLSTVKSLILRFLSDFEKISRNPLIVGSFEKLQNLQVTYCHKLRNIFQLSIVTELVHLETLMINDCESMKEVFCKEREEDTIQNLVFPKLKTLILDSLPSISSFCSGIDKIEFPQLKDLDLMELPQIECLFTRFSNQSIFPHKVSVPSLEKIRLGHLVNMKEIWCGQLQSGSFRNLANLEVRFCDNLRYVFTPFLARYLVHLQKLDIAHCFLLEVIVAKEEDENETEDTALLPKLKIVRISELPSLETFCHTPHDLEFHALDYLFVAECPVLQTFSFGCVHTPKLNNVKFKLGGQWGELSEEIEDAIWVDNLNNTISHIYKLAVPYY